MHVLFRVTESFPAILVCNSWIQSLHYIVKEAKTQTSIAYAEAEDELCTHDTVHMYFDEH